MDESEVHGMVRTRDMDLGVICLKTRVWDVLWRMWDERKAGCQEQTLSFVGVEG